MAVKTKEDLMNFIKEHTKDDTSDETLGFIADFSDTFDDISKKASGETDWKKKYEDNDKEWRQKYRDRFFSGNTDGDGSQNADPVLPPDVTQKDDDKPKTYDDLFTHDKG